MCSIAQAQAPVLDALMRNTLGANALSILPRRAVRAAIAQRDGPFGDYSRAPKSEQPNPAYVIAAEQPTGG